MDEALGEDPWTELHGRHEIPKQSYVNPFQQDKEPADRRDQIYGMEIEASLDKEPAQKPKAEKELKSAVKDL